MLPAKTPDALSDDERARCQEELAKLVGAEAAATFSWLKRLALAADGSILVELKRPRVSRAELKSVMPQHDWAPWHFPDRHYANPLGPGEGGRPGMLDEVEFLPLVEAVELLTGPDNPEAEIKRRWDLLYAAIEKQNDDARRIQGQRQAEREDRADWERKRPERWRALPREQRILLTVAAQNPVRPSLALREIVRLMQAGESALAEVPRTFEEHTRGD